MRRCYQFGTGAGLITTVALFGSGCDTGRSSPIGAGGASTSVPSQGAGMGGSPSSPSAGGVPGSGGLGGSAGAPSTENACATPDASLRDRNAAELFAFPTLPTFDLFLPEETWQALQVNARDEQYVEASACFEGRGIGRVGLRFKGNEGSLYSCFDASGTNTCKKLPLKLKFDEYAEDQRFFGLKRLNFQSNRYDETYLHERLAYDLFRAMGIVGPRLAWATVRVNGEIYGLFGLAEQVDGRFSKDRFPESPDENLFKELWPDEADEQHALEQLETNEEMGDVSAFLSFAQAMETAPEDALRDTLAAYVDLDYWARYLAVDDAIASYDGITTFYTDPAGTWSGNHNFFLYQESASRFVLIPWDEESTFIANSGFGTVPHWTRTPTDCATRYPVWSGGALALAPGCNRVFRALAQDLTAYRAAGRQLLDGPFQEGALIAAIDAHVAHIREHVARDPNGPGLQRFEQSIDFLKQELPRLRARFERLLSGEITTPAEIQTARATDFESLDDTSLAEGPWLGFNPNSTATVSINRESALVGERDLLLRFEYADEVEPWEQWVSYRIPVAGGSFDASGSSGIRLWVRSDEPRSLRFDLDSPNAQRADGGIRPGWELEISDTPNQIEVLFAEAALPDWAGEPADDLPAVLATLTGLVFFPKPAIPDDSGLLGEGVTEPGFLEIDQIEFF